MFVRSPLKCQIISEVFLSSHYKIITTLGWHSLSSLPSYQSLPTCIPVGAENKPMDLSCLLMFISLYNSTWQVGVSQYILAFFNEPTHEWFLPHANLWGIPCKSKHIQVNDYLRTSSEDVQRPHWELIFSASPLLLWKILAPKSSKARGILFYLTRSCMV